MRKRRITRRRWNNRRGDINRSSTHREVVTYVIKPEDEDETVTGTVGGVRMTLGIVSVNVGVYWRLKAEGKD